MYKSVLLISIVIALFVLTNAKESFSGYKKYGNSDFKGGDIRYSETDKKKDCANLCTAEGPGCKGFTVSNKKNPDGQYRCWLKNETGIKAGNRKEDKDKTSYITNAHHAYWSEGLFSKDYNMVGKKLGPEEEGNRCTTGADCSLGRYCSSFGFCNKKEEE